MNATPQPWRMPLLVAVSLALHVLLLGTTVLRDQTSSRNTVQSVLNIALLNSGHSNPATTARTDTPATLTQAAYTAATPLTSAADTEALQAAWAPSAAAQQITAAADPDVSTATVAATAGNEAAGQALSLQLAAQFQHHFNYPFLARQRGWQGQVILNVRIEVDGRVSDIAIADSSGYPLLDQSAVKAAHAVARLEGVSEWLQDRALQVRLPVIYRLTAS
ncbi:MAG: energy transducer TonB [Gammaproteobacteria bacterium]|nr:energy transducer TonB [Gammaproteobacteria bacterium]